MGRTEGPYKGMTVKQVVQVAKDKPGTVRVATVPGCMWEYIVEQIEKQSAVILNQSCSYFREVVQQGGCVLITGLRVAIG